MSDERKTFTQSLDGAIRENPISAALIGMGLLWMFVGRDRIAAAINIVPQAGRAGAGAVSAAASGVSSFVGGAAEGLPSKDGIAEQAGGIAAAAKDRATNLSDSATSIAEAGQGQMAEFFEKQPLLLGAVGLAIGAGVGASFGSTDSENELFGAAAETVKSAVSETVGERAEATLAKIQDEAERQGLTPVKAQEGLRTLADNVKDAASSAITR